MGCEVDGCNATEFGDHCVCLYHLALDFMERLAARDRGLARKLIDELGLNEPAGVRLELDEVREAAQYHREEVDRLMRKSSGLLNGDIVDELLSAATCAAEVRIRAKGKP